MRIRTRTTLSGPVIALAGELDHDSAPEIRDLFPSLPLKHGQQLVVDLGGLTLCDSSGITVLIAARDSSWPLSPTPAAGLRASSAWTRSFPLIPPPRQPKPLGHLRPAERKGAAFVPSARGRRVT
ncbi:STAS domain-containing protein [Streptomyces sp. NPDC058430]|uniref:STAS domain-containing protein n=1 Tax=Streptomyces sp. NPDC058430 TaxID=3346495 RepID=UPI00365D1EF3